MKRIILAIAAITAIAACTKSEVTYEAPGEIGFNVVAGNITKAPATGTAMPDLNMYVNAYVHADANPEEDGTQFPDAPDYINNGEFTKKTNQVKSTNVWGGVVTPYYWPNEQKLHFSGYSKSGNFLSVETGQHTPSASYQPSADKLTITNYTPGESTGLGANDLMWFPSTIHSKPLGYGKEEGKFPDYVEVKMYHTCSWLTFMVQGDETTGGTNSTYKITSLKINGIDLTANVTCTGANASSLSAETLKNYVVWTTDEKPTGEYEVAVPEGGIELKSTCVKLNDASTPTWSPKNVEKNNTKNNEGNVVVIPQVPGKIDIEWTYKSSTNADITDSATGLDLKLSKDDGISNVQSWEPGKHYIYTITLKANEILIAPTPVTWTDQTGGSVTVE